jgi:Sulfotransferase domain
MKNTPHNASPRNSRSNRRPPPANTNNGDGDDSNNNMFLPYECTLLNGTRVSLLPNLHHQDNNQTSAARRMQIPTFIIIGVHKGGTTALRELLQLPGVLMNAKQAQIVASVKREPHYFDWQYEHIIETLYGSSGNGTNASSETTLATTAAATTTSKGRSLAPADDNDKREDERFRRGLCQVRHEYLTQYFDMERFVVMPAAATATTNETTMQYYSYEKTPSYIIKPGAARLVKTIFPWTKIVVSLRNPVERCISHYRMDMERKYEPINKTMEEWLAQDVDILQRLGGYPLPPVSSMPPALRRAWDQIQSTRRNNSHSNNTNSSSFSHDFVSPDWKQTSLLYRGLYAEQLQEWMQYYTLGQDLYIIPFERLKLHPKQVLHDLLGFLQIPTSTTNLSESVLLDKSSSHHGDKQRQAEEEEKNSIYHHSFSPNRGELNVTISMELKSYLRLLFKPYNDDLRNLLSSAALLASQKASSETEAAPAGIGGADADDANSKWLQDMTRHWDG